MDRSPLWKTLWRRAAFGAAVASISLSVGDRSISGGPGASKASVEKSTHATGKPLSLVVNNGKARFSIASPNAGSKTLVIVSALSSSAEMFPLRLSATAIRPEELVSPKRLPIAPRRSPRKTMTPLPPVPPVSTKTPPRERVFHMMVRDGDVASASNYLAVRGNLRAVGDRLQVYVDQSDDSAGSVSDSVLKDVVSTFDDAVFPVAAKTIGQARDVDGDGRFTVFMSSWLTRLAGGRHAVDGYVRGADLDLSLAAPYSNHGDMMYLSTAMTAGPHLRTVIAHEYTHAVTFSAKALAGPPSRSTGLEEEGWLDEAIAHLVEDQHGFSRSNLDYRVSAFLSRPEAYRLVVDDYYAADLFRSHGNRGATYLFLRWCVDRFGPDLIPALVRSNLRGVRNLEVATGERFEDLYRGWSLALFFSGFDPMRVDSSGFQSIDARKAFNDWDLAGPRTVSVTPDGPEFTWNSTGTASRYLVVESSPTGAAKIVVTAPEGANLQVTAVPLPDDLARMELTAIPEPGGFRLSLREAGGTPVTLTSIAWEPLVPGPDPHAPGFRHDSLDATGIAAACGSTTLTALGELISRPIPAPSRRGPVVVKAVGTDAFGRRVAAWAELPGIEVSRAAGAEKR